MKPEDGADIGIIIRMMLSRPFRLVTPTVDGDVLAVLARADAAFTPPQVRDLIDMRSVEGVRNALRRLTAQGIVTRERYGNAYVYRLNRAHVAARHIIGLAESGDEVLQRMREQLATWSVPCEFAALFGSAATGSMTEESDIDVLVDIAREAGLDAEAARDFLQDPAQLEDVARADAQARSMGISGVPFFIFNQKLAVSGAQDPATLLDAMQQAVAAVG
jgi:predicted nucleotidyltransferase